MDENDAPVGAVNDGDAVIIFNFRADRVVEISKALEYEKFDKFERKRFPKVCSLYPVANLLLSAECGVMYLHRLDITRDILSW